MMEKQMSKQALRQAKEALELCVRQLYHDGVPTDKAHPKRIAADAAEKTLADLATVSDAQPPEGYCADCNTWGGGHAERCQRRPERFFIRQRPAPAVPQGWRERLQAMREADYTYSQYPELARVVFDSVIDALDELEAAPVVPSVPVDEFKNFHRLLCERFNYLHDETDWKRDQLSLIEHIATKVLSVPVSDEMADMVSKAMRRSWQLGQIYWQQADSDSYSQNKKSDETERQFKQLVDETRDMLAAPAPAVPVEAQPEAWLYSCSKPGQHMVYASVDENDTNHWPLDQWKSVEKIPLYDRPAPDVPPSALTDEEVWDIYKHAVNKVRKTGGRKFAIALTREIIRLSTPASVPSDEHPLSGMYINQGSMDAAADAYAAEYEAAKEERFMALKHRNRELETEISDLRNTLRARESERDNALEMVARWAECLYPRSDTPKIIASAIRALKSLAQADIKDRPTLEEIRATCRHAFEDDIDCGGHPYERCALCGQTR